jgi:hypothetical protein
MMCGRGTGVRLVAGTVAAGVLAVFAWRFLAIRPEATLYKSVTPTAREYYGRYLQHEAETALSRGNALRAMEILLAGKYGAYTPTHLLTATLNYERVDGGCPLLGVDTFGGQATFAQLILVFKLPDGKTGQIIQELNIEHTLGVSSFLTVRALEVPVEDLAGIGDASEDGTVHIKANDVCRIQACAIRAVPVPDVDVAVALRLGDGSYTSFVPLLRRSALCPGAVGETLARPVGPAG